MAMMKAKAAMAKIRKTYWMMIQAVRAVMLPTLGLEVMEEAKTTVRDKNRVTRRPLLPAKTSRPMRKEAQEAKTQRALGI